MADQPSFKEVLQQVAASDGYKATLEFAHRDKALPSFVARWLNSADSDNIWEKFAADIEKRIGKSRQECYNRLARCGIWEFAHILHEPPETFRPQALQSRRDKFLELAKYAEALAKYWRNSARGRPNFPHDNVLGEEDYERYYDYERVVSERATRARHYEQDAEYFRQSADDRVGIPYDCFGRYQKDGGVFSLQARLFVERLTRSLQRDFEQSDNKVVAAIANLAYEGLDADGENVRVVLRQAQKRAKPEVAHSK
jgi:hypothetical protein